jgi:hypothetical protein
MLPDRSFLIGMFGPLEIVSAGSTNKGTEKLGKQESAVRKAGAWVAERFSRVKIRLSDFEEGQIGLFHALEGLVLGIFGKRGPLDRSSGSCRYRAATSRIGLRTADKACSGSMRARRGETLRGRARCI